MNNWQSYNPNPVSGQRVGDCTVRAISKATGQDWETTYANKKTCKNKSKNMQIQISHSLT